MARIRGTGRSMGIVNKHWGKSEWGKALAAFAFVYVFAGPWGLGTSAGNARTTEARGTFSQESRREHFAVLASGQRGAVKWTMFTFRGPGAKGGASPCIEEVDQIYRGFASGTDCAPFAPPGSEPARTEFSTSLPAGKRGVEVSITIIGMLFGQQVRQVRLTMNSGPDMVRHTRLLTTRQARRARVRPLRYLAFDLGRRACVEAVTAFDDGGREVLSTPREPCRPG